MIIRNLDEGLKARRHVRAARHNRSIKDETRAILPSAVDISPSRGQNLADAIRARLEPLGGVELETTLRQPVKMPPESEHGGASLRLAAHTTPRSRL